VEVSRIRSILVTRDQKRNAASSSPRFVYSSGLRTSPIHFALLGRKRKYIKSKTTAKLIEKRTSIAAVRDKLGQIDTFLTPLFWLPTTVKLSFLKAGFGCHYTDEKELMYIKFSVSVGKR
jgi:hypothetical protein